MKRITGLPNPTAITVTGFKSDNCIKIDRTRNK
jgi:hypothetical protein